MGGHAGSDDNVTSGKLPRSGLVQRTKSKRFDFLRHTYCMFLFAAGTNLKTVQYLMSHDDPATTLGIYTHYVESNGVKAASAIEKMMANLSTAPRIVPIKTPSTPRCKNQNRPTPKTLTV